MATVYQVASTAFRYGDVDSTTCEHLSNKEEAYKLAELWAKDMYDGIIEHNQNWYITETAWGWEVFEEGNTKWFYLFEVNEVNIDVCDKIEETDTYKEIMEG